MFFHVQVVTAIDGDELLAAGNRWKPLEVCVKNKWRLTYNFQSVSCVSRDCCGLCMFQNDRSAAAQTRGRSMHVLRIILAPSFGRDYNSSVLVGFVL